jgi:hypothetical protein
VRHQHQSEEEEEEEEERRRKKKTEEEERRKKKSEVELNATTWNPSVEQSAECVPRHTLH